MWWVGVHMCTRFHLLSQCMCFGWCKMQCGRPGFDPCVGTKLLAFALLHSVLSDQICLLLQLSLDFLLLHYRGLECKSRKSRDNWSNRQIWLWSTKWSRAKSNTVLPRKHTDSKHHPPTTQEKTLHSTSPDDQYWNQINYILCSQRQRSPIQSAKTRLAADCSSDHELLIAKFRLKWKKVGKTTRPVRYDLNQILYDYRWKWEIDLRA